VYLTYPFVLSWSMLEAMACGCPIIGSDTAPVREVLRHGETGWLVDFFDPDAIARQLAAVLKHPQAARSVGISAMRVVRSRYARESSSRAYDRLLLMDRTISA